MTANRRLKRRVRARAAKTGESYTAALRHLRRAEEANMSNYELRHGGATDTGQVRRSNQDQLLVEPRLAVVADGMGDVGRGEIASSLAVQVLREGFDADPSATGLVEATLAANRTIWERTEAEPELRGIGSTIAAVALVSVVGEERLAIVNVGDSRAYLFAAGNLRRLTLDHSFVGDLVRSGQLSEEEARSHPERHVLSQALGIGPDVAPHADLAPARPGDRILLCSDGLFNEIDDDEIMAVLADEPDPTTAAQTLVQRAKDHGGNDNVTAVVLDIT